MKDRSKLLRVRNAFCPTGPGGGVDPSCSPNEMGGGLTGVEVSTKAARISSDGGKTFLPGRFHHKISSNEGWMELEETPTAIEVKDVEVQERFRGKGLGKALYDQALKLAKSRGKSGITTYSSSRTESANRVIASFRKQGRVVSGSRGEELITVSDKSTTNSLTVNPFVSEAQRRACHAKDDPGWDCDEWDGKTRNVHRAKSLSRVVKNAKSVRPNRFDPTRTTTLRKLFVRRLRVRYGLLKAEILKFVRDRDVFGLKPRPVPAGVILTNTDWAFNPTPDQVRQFREWVRRQIREKIRGLSNDDLWRKYVEAGFKKGAARSFDDYTKARPGLKKEKPEFYAGSKHQFLESSFRQPVAVDKVKLLASRTFDELENIDSDMSTKITRALTDGLVAGKGRDAVARDMMKQVDVGRQRAETIAQTELIRAHADGQLMALEELGVEELGVAVEWSTAGDSAVCDLCEPLAGIVIKLDEAKGMIPRHPNCRCSFVPANVGEVTKGQSRTAGAISKDIGVSVGRGSKTDDWVGKDKTISRDRPKSQVGNAVRTFSHLLKGLVRA